MKINFADKKITIKELCDMCGGSLIRCGIDENSLLSGICTDSRQADAETLFIAIKGEVVDGHDYIAQTAEKGFPFALASRIPDMKGADKYGIILVDDTVSALGRMAQAYRSRIPVRTIGITGSVGKTTTKEFVSSVVSEHCKLFKTEGNYNSVIGLPASVLGMPEDVEAAVLEMGMSGFGEISTMSRIAMPDIAIVTTIGTSHMEMLGSRENICRAKMEIIDGLSENGILILNGDEPLLLGADKRNRKTVYVGIENRNADVRALNIRMGISNTLFDLLWNGRIYSNIELPVMGQHNVYAALFAFAVGKELGMDVETIRRGLMNYHSIGMRQNIYELSSLTLIEDCYNASPESMRSAIDVLTQLSKSKNGARRVAVLGDMLELGENSHLLHRDVGTYLAKSGCEVLFTYGERAKNIALSAIENGMKPQDVYVNLNKGTPGVTGEMLIHALRGGDILLFKASRSMEAEKIIEYLKENMDKLPK